ncbi:hypothetical protein CR513_45118, partial [Mucuna pruriens]
MKLVLDWTNASSIHKKWFTLEGMDFYMIKMGWHWYFLYGITVLTKLDPGWRRKYKLLAFSLVEDFMNLDTQPQAPITLLVANIVTRGHQG